MSPDLPAPSPELKKRNRLVLGAFLLICAAPIVASYLAYFVFKPAARTNYGTLVEPQRTVPELHASTLDGKPFSWDKLAGVWVMISVDGATCGESCATKLYEMRQIRLTTGKDRERIACVWFITDDKEVPRAVLEAYAGTTMLRVDPTTLDAWLLPSDASRDHLFLVDPHRNLMMQFPRDADPYRVKRDLSKLLMASEIG